MKDETRSGDEATVRQLTETCRKLVKLPLLDIFNGVKTYFTGKNREDVELSLNGSDDRSYTFLLTLLNNAEKKINHLDDLRQKIINYALIVFAGLFGFGMTLSHEYNKSYISISLTVLMVIFCLLDQRFHKMSHGWQETKKILIHKISKTINEPTKNITFPRYSVKGERTVELFSLQSIIFYLLIAGGVMSFFIL